MVTQVRLLLCYLEADATNWSRFATCIDGIAMRFRAWPLLCSSHAYGSQQAGGFPRRFALTTTLVGAFLRPIVRNNVLDVRYRIEQSTTSVVAREHLTSLKINGRLLRRVEHFGSSPLRRQASLRWRIVSLGLLNFLLA